LNPLDRDLIDSPMDVLDGQLDHFELPEKREHKPQQKITLVHVIGAAGLLLVLPLLSGPVFKALGIE
jgi:hypothetical protein